jgi:anti-sigma factor RsiW
MTCEQAIELLPWLLNGTLEPQEREEVRQHLRTCERCREALPETQTAWRLFDEHLPTEALVALAYGETPAGLDPASAEQHLASCAQCAAELELARMSRRLEDEENVALFPGATSRQVRGEESRSWRSAALAAGLAGVVALSGWVHSARQLDLTSDRLAAAARETGGRAEAPATPPPVAAGSGDQALRQQLAAAQAQMERLETLQKQSDEAVTQAQQQLAQIQKERGPRINSFTEDLGNPDAVRAEASREQVPADRDAHLLLQKSKDEGLPESREIQILDQAGKVVWQDTGLIPDKHGSYSLGWPAGFLAPGQYTVQLFTQEGGKRVPRERWEIEVVKSLPAAD